MLKILMGIFQHGILIVSLICLAFTVYLLIALYQKIH